MRIGSNLKVMEAHCLPPYKVEAITPHRVRIVFKMLGSENENKVQREKILHMTNSKQK